MTTNKRTVTDAVEVTDPADPLAVDAIADPGNKELAEIIPQRNTVLATSPMEIIAQAVERGADVDVLGKMFDLYERDQARISALQFDAAMAKFQADAPAIQRVKEADRYWYAPIEAVMQQIQPALTAHGLSVRFDTKLASDGYLTALCTVAHTGGHKETSEFTCPVDKDNKSKINVSQLQGSANSYAKRYALSNALNIVYVDEDDDGAKAGTKTITADQATEIRDLIKEKKVNEGLFFQWVGADTYEGIPANKYEAIKREYGS